MNCSKCGKQLSFDATCYWNKLPVCRSCLDKYQYFTFDRNLIKFKKDINIISTYNDILEVSEDKVIIDVYCDNCHKNYRLNNPNKNKIYHCSICGNNLFVFHLNKNEIFDILKNQFKVRSVTVTPPPLKAAEPYNTEPNQLVHNENSSINNISSIKPLIVKMAVYLLYASLGVGVLKLILNLSSISSSILIGFSIIILVIILAVFYILIFNISSGRNWSRITMFLLFLIGLPFNISLLFKEITTNIFLSILSISQILLQLIALILLFQGASNNWFKYQK